MADENGAVVLVLGAGMLIGGLFVWLILRSSAPAAATRRAVYAPVYMSEETWEWVDWEGKPRKIVRKAQVGNS